MAHHRKYKFNPETLQYELVHLNLWHRIPWILAVIPVSLLLAFVYYYVYTETLHLKSPRLVRLEREYEEAQSKVAFLNKQISQIDSRLDDLKVRDNKIYRNIFGMEQITDDVRNAGFGGSNRYSYLDYSDNKDLLVHTALGFDKVFKKAYVQSLSFDDVERMAGQTEELAKCIPSILPIPEDTPRFRFSSSFGYRKDPKYGDLRMHQGIDLTGALNSPVYATGNGRVEAVTFEYNGYGRYVVIDHGFGYKTKYAHLNTSTVYEGQMVKRGERIGLLGSSGKSTGPHVHYEVLYMNRPVNPYNYFNNNIASDDYHAVIMSGH